MPQPVKLKIKFKSANLDQFIKRYSVDVSRGGIFVRTKNPLEVGTKLRFEFLLQDASPLIVGEGTVVWIREYDPGRKKVAPGMGVRFDQLSPESEEVLQKILDKKSSSKDRAPKVRGEVATGSFLATDTAESKEIEKEKKGDSAPKPEKKSDETAPKTEEKAERSPKKASAESAEEVSSKPKAEKIVDKKEVKEAKAEVEPAKKAEKAVDKETEEKAEPTKKPEKETEKIESKETKDKDDKKEVKEAKDKVDKKEVEAEDKEKPTKKPVAKAEEAEEAEEKDEPVKKEEKKAEEKEVEKADKEVKETKSDKETVSSEKSSSKDEKKEPPVEARPAMDEPQEGGALWPVVVLIGLVIVAIAGYIIYTRTRNIDEARKPPRPAISEKPTADAEVEDTGVAMAGDVEKADASVPEEKCDKVEIEVISDPPDAKVVLDDQNTEKTTPAKLCLEEGSGHTVELKKDGYKDYSFPRFKTKQGTKLNAKLSPMVYSLLLSSRPRGATVLIDGEIHGCKTTCNLKLPFADEWTITLRRRGYEDKVIKLKRNDPEWKEITSGFRYRHYVELDRNASAPIPTPREKTRDTRKTPRPQRETTEPSETDEPEEDDGAADKPDKETRPTEPKKPDKETRPTEPKKPDKEARPAGDKKPTARKPSQEE